jgi:hypothetical protein
MMTTKEGFAMKNLFMTMLIVLVFTLSLGHAADMTKYGGGSGGSSILTSYTVAALPGAPTAGQQVMVTDGNSTTDCTVGGGAEIHICLYNGTTWVSAGIAGSATVSNTPYDATSWNGEAGVAPSKDAVRDKFETLGTMSIATATDYVAKALYDAHTILYATSDNTPAALTVGASTIVGRKASGNISAISTAEMKTLLGYPTSGDYQTPITNPVTGTGTNHHWAYWTGTAVVAGKAVTASKVVCSDGSGDPVACTNLTDAAIPTASTLHLDDVVTLTGVAAESVNLATFTGSTIPDNQTIKAALQALETADEAKLPLAGGTLTGKLITKATAAGASGLNMPHGTVPDAPVNGDCWTTTAGLYCQINGSTQGPFTSTGGTGYATVQEEGSNLTQRTIINFIGGGITAADDAGNTRTNVTLSTMLSSIAALADPNADGILFWDDSESAYKFLTASTGLSISAANLTVDRTALGTGTWGSGSGIVWTFNASSGVDPVLTLGDGVFNISTGTIQQGGTAVSLAGHTHADTAITSTTANKLIYTTAGSVLGELTAITASRALASDVNGLPVASATTATELGYISGLTSAIQTQLGTKAPTANPTLTGLVTIPAYAAGTAGLVINTTAVQSTATQLNYLSAATGTTGTTSGNLVYSVSPVFTGTPTLPTGTIATTQTQGNNSTAIATTAYADTLGATKGTISGTPAQYQWGVWNSATAIKGVAVTGSKVVCSDSNGQPVACTNLTDLAFSSYLPLAGGTMTGRIVATTPAAGASGYASINLPHGAAPTTNLTNGDCWTTTAGLYCRINGATIGPYGASTATIGGSLAASANYVTTSQGTANTIQATPVTIDSSGNMAAVGTFSAGAGGFTVDADGDVTAKSITMAKVSGTAGDMGLYEANSTDTDTAGFRGPTSLTGNTSFRGQFPTARPTSGTKNALIWTGSSGSGDGTPATPYIHAMSFVDLDTTYLALAGGTLTGKLIAATNGTAAGLNLTQSSGDPSSPINGDIWILASGLYARIAGATVGPFSTGAPAFSAITGATNTNALVIGNSGSLGATGTGTITATSLGVASQAAGDTFYATSGTAIARLAKGTAYQIPQMNSGATAPEWTSTLGATGTRLTKGWFTDIESTNMPTVGGVAITSIANTWANAQNITWSPAAGIRTLFYVTGDITQDGTDSWTGLKVIPGTVSASSTQNVIYGLHVDALGTHTNSSGTGIYINAGWDYGLVSRSAPIKLGEAGTYAGSIVFENATSGSITMRPITGALGTSTLVLGTTYTDGKVCTYATATGLTCNSDTLANPMSAAGDLIYGGTSGAATRLAVAGQPGYIMTSGTTAGGTVPVWLAPGAAGTMFRGATTTSTPTWSTATYADTYVQGGILHAATANTIAALAPGAVGSFLMSNGAGAALSYLAAGAANYQLVGAGTTTIPVWTASTGTGSPVLGTGPSITPQAYDGHAAASPTAAQLSNAIVNNYGQTTANVSLTGPTPAAGMNFIMIAGTAQGANYWRYTSNTTNVYLDGSGTAVTYVGFATPAIGNAISCFSFQTGASSYSLKCTTLSGTSTSG